MPTSRDALRSPKGGALVWGGINAFLDRFTTRPEGIHPANDRQGRGVPASWYKKSLDSKALRESLGAVWFFGGLQLLPWAAQKRGDPGDPGETVNESDLFFLCLAELQGLNSARVSRPREAAGRDPGCALTVRQLLWPTT